MKHTNLKELRTQAQEIREDIKKAEQEREANARSAALYEAMDSKSKSLWGKLRSIEEKMEHLDRYDADVELYEIVANFTNAAEENWQRFKFFEKAEANFVSINGIEGRQLHVDIVCFQICDHDIKTVLENAEKVAGRKITDWFVSASIGYNPQHNARAWLTYHLTFKGEDK